MTNRLSFFTPSFSLQNASEDSNSLVENSADDDSNSNLAKNGSRTKKLRVSNDENGEESLDQVEDDNVEDEENDEQKKIRIARENLPPLGAMVSLEDFEKLATQILPNTAYAYYSSAGDDENTLRENVDAWKRYWFRPSVLVDITKIDLTTTIMGIKSALPVFISPAAMARLGHPLGEINLTKGAAQTGIIQGISSNASCTLEEMCDARSPDQPLIFQLYLNWDRQKSAEVVRKVEALKMNGIMFTVDAPVPGKRERDLRAKGDFDDEDGGTKGVAQAISGYQAADLSWKDVEWLKTITDLPLIIKGVQSVEDAKLAAKSGVKAIVLSNHGGRQLNFAPASIDVLREIREEAPEVFDQLEVYVDGGVRRGTDVLKALCLGAKAVGLGRPFLYAQSAYGEQGVVRAVQILEEELATGLRLLGATDLSQLNPAMLRYLDNKIK